MIISEEPSFDRSNFRAFLTVEQITLFLVHICGLLFDLFVGFGLFFDRSRPIAIFFCASFHLMNSQLFNIGKRIIELTRHSYSVLLGMFPYAMLATIPIFFHNNWPRAFLSRHAPKWLYKEGAVQFSPSCLYSKEEIKPEESKKSSPVKSKVPTASSVKNAPVKSTFRHHFFAIFALLYLSEQTFLPYSHFITKGYNNWTNVSSISLRPSFGDLLFSSSGSLRVFVGHDDSQLAYVRHLLVALVAHMFLI